MRLIDEYPWRQPEAQMCSVKMACGAALVTWPSGHRTLEQYAGTAVMSDLEIAMARDADNLKAMKSENLANTMADYRRMTWRAGWLVRKKYGRRPKARQAVSVEWLAPSTYRGPAPIIGSLLPEAH